MSSRTPVIDGVRDFVAGSEGGAPKVGRASGANVNNGTDIWFASLATTAFAVGDWTSSSRITRNTLTSAALSSANAKATISGARSGCAGEHWADQCQCGDGGQGLRGEQYVRYQVFPWNQPPSTGADGCIISTPSENARRVRFLTQEPPNATQLVFIYKQGDYTQGGPSDIFLRRATGGLLTPDSLQPPVDAVNCTNSSNDDEDVLVTLADQPPALNFSGSNALKGGTGTAPDATSGANPIENALAHAASCVATRSSSATAIHLTCTASSTSTIPIRTISGGGRRGGSENLRNPGSSGA
ncbi:MAG: hypothetical protein IPO08_17815 [Xanthomonadales bacterium]|nr:hypothetical protein [Xanthomonadales bacterium]